MSKEAVVTGVTVKAGAVLVDAYSVGRVMTTYSKIPLLTSYDGVITVPKQGHKIIISETDNGMTYVEGVLTITGKEAPDLKEEEFALQFDPSTRMKVTKDGSGNYTMNIEASGDMTVKASGDLTLDTPKHLQLNANSVDIDTS